MITAKVGSLAAILVENLCAKVGKLRNKWFGRNTSGTENPNVQPSDLANEFRSI